MNKIFFFYRHIDEFLFKRIDKFKDSSYYLKYVEELSKFDESIQRKINQTLGYLLFSLPFLIIFILFLNNLSTKNDLSTKRDIIQLANEVQYSKDRLNAIGKNIISQFKINKMEDLQNRLQVILEEKQINLNDVQVDNFSITSPISGISQVQADIIFQNFSSNDLSSFLTGIMVESNGKISSVNINKKKGSLAGKVHFIQYEKDAKRGK